ncbi:hypothetical protein cand_000930 [Cryptosporidium andersoni]|uniref:Major facilitator superfamily protein n=1 Tax=Cryptosporidium andersoni TaxID=117008 RepID=A0A1J4MU69_9CRYT|nr:hypothetical protein cand_000930 [Cryptosporidium andersoni]
MIIKSDIPRNIVLIYSYKISSLLYSSTSNILLLDTYLNKISSEIPFIGFICISSTLGIFTGTLFAVIINDTDLDSKYLNLILKLCGCFLLSATILLYFSIDLNSVILLCVASFLSKCVGELVDIIIESIFTSCINQGDRSLYFIRLKILSDLTSIFGPFISLILFLIYGDSWEIKPLKNILKTNLILSIPQSLILIFWDLLDDKNWRYKFILNYNKKSEFKPNIKLGFLKSSNVPYLILVSQFITTSGAGISMKTFSLFLNSVFKLTPINICLLNIVGSLTSLIFSIIIHKLCKYSGRAIISLIFCFLTSFILLIMSEVESTSFLVGLYILRAGFQNACIPIDHSIIMDFTPSDKVFQWRTLYSFLKFVWLCITIFSGRTKDTNLESYKQIFVKCAFLYFLANLIYAPSILLVPSVESFEEFRSNFKITRILKIKNFISGENFNLDELEITTNFDNEQYSEYQLEDGKIEDSQYKNMINKDKETLNDTSKSYYEVKLDNCLNNDSNWYYISHIETDDDTPTNSNISMELSRRKLNTLQTFINEDYHKD